MIAAVGLTLTGVIVAMASRSPISHPTAINAQSAQAPTTALVIVLLGVGIVMLGALLTLAWGGRRRKHDPPEHEPTPIRASAISKVAAIVLSIALGAALVVAGVIGTRPVNRTPQFASRPFGLVSPGSSPTRSGGSGFVLPAWLPWTLLALVAVALATGLFVLWLRRDMPPEEATKADAGRVAVEAALGALEIESDPRRAVIAAYAAMQRSLGERGVVRSPAEAPREFLRRALVASRVTEGEARTLTGLFEEARYSTHPIREHLREVALSALHSLQARLQADGAE